MPVESIAACFDLAFSKPMSRHFCRIERNEACAAGFRNSRLLAAQSVVKCGLRQADEVVFLGDGATWIRNEKRKHFGRDTFIIDWYHALEHIWDCGKVLLGEGSKATEKWVKKRESWLWDGQTRKLLNDL